MFIEKLMQFPGFLIVKYDVCVIFRPVGGEKEYDRHCIISFLREPPANDHRRLLLLDAFDHSCLFELLETRREDSGRDTGERFKKAVEAVYVVDSNVTE